MGRKCPILNIEYKNERGLHMADRIQKLISACGAASRRKAEKMITQGRVRLNGNTAHLGDTADLSEDVIEIDGKRLKKPDAPMTLLLNKPRGYVTTASDEKGRKTVMELLHPEAPRLYPVGRLDMFSEGLLLLTNDGALAQRLTHPSKEVEKEYHLWVSDWHDGADELLRRPIVLDGRKISPPKVKLLSVNGKIAMLSVTIHEGRNRQVRRMCEQAQLTVTRLKRVREGELRLNDLPTGAARALTQAELDALQGI